MSKIACPVSVIIPVYNQGQYLGGAIDSVLAQTVPPMEIIVVDDGSTDETPEVARGFGEVVRYIRQENEGSASARNTGIRAAHSPFVALLDSDDQWHPQFLNTMMTRACSSPRAGVWYAWVRCIDEQGCDLSTSTRQEVIPPSSMFKRLLRANFLIPSAMIMRRSSVVDAGLFDVASHSCEDLDLWLRLARNVDFIGIPQVLVSYRVHTNSKSRRVQRNYEDILAVMRKHFGPDEGLAQTWSADKRMAYGAAHRYAAIATLMERGDWNSGAVYLQRAFEADPTLADDLDLFYELALGAQPYGQRGVLEGIPITANAQHVIQMLDHVFHKGATHAELAAIQERAYAQAYAALGRVAYGARQMQPARHYFDQALRLSLSLTTYRAILPLYLKSWLSPRLLDAARQVRRARVALSSR